MHSFFPYFEDIRTNKTDHISVGEVGSKHHIIPVELVPVVHVGDQHLRCNNMKANKISVRYSRSLPGLRIVRKRHRGRWPLVHWQVKENLSGHLMTKTLNYNKSLCLMISHPKKYFRSNIRAVSIFLKYFFSFSPTTTND